MLSQFGGDGKSPELIKVELPAAANAKKVEKKKLPAKGNDAPQLFRYAIPQIDAMLGAAKSKADIIATLRRDPRLNLFRPAAPASRAASDPVQRLLTKALSVAPVPAARYVSAPVPLKFRQGMMNYYRDIVAIDAHLRKMSADERARIATNTDYVKSIARDLQREVSQARGKQLAAAEMAVAPMRAVAYPVRGAESTDKFNQALFSAFSELGLPDKETIRFCPKDTYITKAQRAAIVNTPSLQQQTAPMMLNPNSPYHGLMLYHMVGTGKTRTALSVLKNFRGTGTRMIWVTTIRASGSLPTQNNDFPFFDGTRDSPFKNGASMKTHNANEIALFTYESFMNALGVGSDHNDYGRKVLKLYSGPDNKSTGVTLGQALENTIIVVDEAHKLFEKKNGAGQGQYAIERAAYESYRTSFDRNAPHRSTACKWLLLTATPMPTIEIPKSERGKKKVKTAGGPQAAFRLLNMLIPYPERRLPVDHAASFVGMSDTNKKRIALELPQQDIDAFRSNDYIQLAQGLVSYFYPQDENWNNIFADVEGEDDLVEVRLYDDEKKYERVTRKLNATCQTYIKSKDVGKIARCYLRRLHWFGDNLQPKRNKGSCGGRDCLPGNLAKCADPNKCSASEQKAFNHLNVPRAATLVKTIQELDAADQKKFGRKFKHVIYSSEMRYTADMYATALVTAGGFEYMEPKNRYAQLGLSIGEKNKELVLKVADRAKFNANKSDNVLFFMSDDLTKRKFAEMEVGFNENSERLNRNGDIARIIVLGAGRKEALSLHDVRYIHIMEPQATETDTRQIVGRARRYCSHIGLKPKERKLRVLMYGLKMKEEDLKLNTLENTENNLAVLSLDALKMSPEIGSELNTRKKILTWMEYGAYDIALSGKSDQQIDAALKAADALEAKTQTQVFFRQPTRKVSEIAAGADGAKAPRAGTKAAIIAQCEESKGIKLLSKVKQSKAAVVACCTPDAPPVGCLSTRRRKREAVADAPAAPPANKVAAPKLTPSQLENLKKLCGDKEQFIADPQLYNKLLKACAKYNFK